MRRPFAIVFLGLATLASVVRADLNDDVRRALGGLRNASCAAQVIRLGATRDQDIIIADVNGNRPLIPASNLKVITTADSLTTLGEDFRFRTRLLVRGDTLAIIGDGDPTFGDSDYLEGSGWTITTVFQNWAAELKKNHLTQFSRILVDDSIFEESMFQPNWPTNQAHKDYVPQVAGLNLNANCLDVYVTKKDNGTVGYRIDPDTNYVTVTSTVKIGSRHLLDLSRVLGTNRILLRGEVNGTNRTPFRVTIHDPPMYAGTVFKETLQAAGIQVTGEVARDRTIRGAIEGGATDTGWQLVAVNETPLIQVLPRTNKNSINLYAECIGKRIAAQRFGKPGSWALVAQSQAAFMQVVGAPPEGHNVFDDGCGLSKENAVAPSAFCATLAFMYHGEHRQRFIDSLSVGGVDGTLQNRFKTNGLAQRVFGKSGSVSGVSTLTGYLQGNDGTWYVFSVLCNEVNDVAAAKRTQDEIVRLVDVQGAAAPAIRPAASPTTTQENHP